MNNHKCQGKRKDNGEWVEGYYLIKQDPLLVGVIYHFIIVQERDNCGCLMSTTTWHKVIPETVRRYTGKTVKDKNLLEGDILERSEDFLDCFGRFVSRVERGVVIWDDINCCFSVKTDIETKPFYCWEWESFSIVGNMYDNPEKLKSELWF